MTYILPKYITYPILFLYGVIVIYFGHVIFLSPQYHILTIINGEQGMIELGNTCRNICINHTTSEYVKKLNLDGIDLCVKERVDCMENNINERYSDTYYESFRGACLYFNNKRFSPKIKLYLNSTNLINTNNMFCYSKTVNNSVYQYLFRDELVVECYC